MTLKWLIIITSAWALSGCASLLQNYHKKEQQNAHNKQSNTLLSSLFGDFENNNNEIEQQKSSLNKNENSKHNNEPNRAPVGYQQPLGNLELNKIDGNTWRTSAHPAMVFGIMARILSQAYIINSVDRKNFNLQTDWDKFFIDGRLFRNRMSVMVFPVGPRLTEVVVKNIVEYYTGNPNNKLEENSAWLPSPDLTNEVQKLVENTNRQTTLLQTQSRMRIH